jgi:hypothetical protein
MRNLSVPENYGFDTIISDYFYRSPFPTSHLYGCLEVLINDIRGITTHITESKIHISYSENHESSLMSLILHVTPSNPLPIIS